MSAKTEAVIDFSDVQRKRSFLARVGVLTGLWRVSFKPAKPKRSLKANAYFWAAVVPAMQQFLKDHGQYFNAYQVYEFLLQSHGATPVIDPTTGEVMCQVGNRSSEMDSDEFAAFVNDSIGMMQDRWGIVVPEPDYFSGAAPKAAPVGAKPD